MPRSRFASADLTRRDQFCIFVSIARYRGAPYARQAGNQTRHIEQPTTDYSRARTAPTKASAPLRGTRVFG